MEVVPTFWIGEAEVVLVAGEAIAMLEAWQAEEPDAGYGDMAIRLQAFLDAGDGDQ